MQLEYEKSANWFFCLNDPGSESALTSADVCRLACISVVIKLVIAVLTGLMEADVPFLLAPALTGVTPTLLLAPKGAYGMKNCPP